MKKAVATCKGPRYAHDCPKCVFKGSFGGFDVWVCPSPIDRGSDSLVARSSKDVADYASFPRFVFVKVVNDHLAGNIGDVDGRKIEAKLPAWMLAILVHEYGEEVKP